MELTRESAFTAAASLARSSAFLCSFLSAAFEHLAFFFFLKIGARPSMSRDFGFGCF